MNLDLRQNLDRMRDEFAERKLDAILAENGRRGRERALLAIGRFAAFGDGILDSRAIRALDAFRVEKLHEPLGYRHFDDFLSRSEHAPVSKSQFYDLRKVLQNEGDKLFDLLNSMGVPASRRRHLGPGWLTLEGSTVVAQIDGEEARIPVNERTQIVEAVRLMSARAAITRRPAAPAQGANHPATPDAAHPEEPFSEALVTLADAFTELSRLAAEMHPDERAFRAPRTFELIAGQMERLSDAFGRNDWNRDWRPSKRAGLGDDELDSFI
jgi:hypothetical protein